VVDLGALERMTGNGAGGRLIELAVDDPAAAPTIAGAVERVLGAGYLVSDWQRLNRELFTALRLQQLALFLVLGLIVLVSTFNVASTLVVLVRERRRDIGVLAALGLPPVRLRLTFLLYGAALGAVGIALGVGVGWLACWVLDTFRLIRFGPEVAAIYFIDAVPFRVDPLDVLAVVGFGIVVTVLACWLPSRRAVRLEPSAALRYE
jgi:lipoprotein-releasing system permease protein